MASPSTRAGLVDYGKRQLGFPVLEINIADEQVEDLIDDTIQVYQDRHYDGVELMYMKYKITQIRYPVKDSKNNLLETVIIKNPAHIFGKCIHGTG